MRRVLFFIAIFLFTLSSVMGQKIPINLPADGNWPTIVGDSIMIIGPRQNELTEEQRYFNPVYLMVYPGKEHLKAQMIRAGACDCYPTIPNRRIGVFSVAPNKQVSFSQGNLQYLPAINLWKFADTQYEYLGNANKYLKPTFRNWVDLFGWSANNTTAPFGVSTSTNAADYAGDFVDWGTNTICGDMPGIWRTLSVDEWDYLFKKRTNAAQLYSKGSIEGTRGMIVLPDNWALPEGVQFTVDTANLTMDLDLNAYSYAEWQKMEGAGAVFLCVTGRRDGKEVGYLQEYGGYWSSTTTSITTYHWFFNYIREVLTLYDNSNRVQGRSVRLVHDTIVPETIPEPCLIVKVNDTLSINMMCVEGGTFMMGATENDTDAENDEYPQHQVTVSDYMIGQTEVTQELWTAVMGSNPSKNQGNYLPVEQVTWDECQEFVAKLNQLTGKHFRLPTEAEWEFAARGGNKSKGYKYSGSDNLSDVAWYDGNSGNKTHKVGTKQPNELGIFDMSGNVYEKCQDWYAPYTAEAQVNPQGPAEPQTYRVVRGGCSGSQATNNSERVCRVINRGYARTTSRESITGLRLVLDTAEYIPAPEPAKRIGVFSVAADKQVSFSQGNLQYIQSTDTWQFAREQYEYIGEDCLREDQMADTIDLMGWSTDNPLAPWGLIFAQRNNYYYGSFVDWGVNTISNDLPNTWRTLTSDEWTYLLQTRPTSNMRYTYGNINGIEGVFLFPDDWSGIDEVPISSSSKYQANPITLAQWELLENSGVVFLPSCGVYMGKTYNYPTAGLYWTSTADPSDEGQACAIYITSSGSVESWFKNRSTNRSVRLVHDTIVPKPEPEYVDLGLSVKWATFNVGATLPEDYGDYFAWGETESKETYSWATYKWCEGTDANITKYNTADGKTILEPADDAAQVHWGGKWRMPTKEECQELLDKCTWKEETRNGINGHIVTGPNGNSIFIPTTGYHNDDNGTGVQGLGTITYLWTSSTPGNANAYDLLLSHPTLADGIGSNTRRVGMPIRPVYDDRPPKRIGVFSVAADKQVSFSQGNLQYIQSTDTWQFAANQLEYMGHKHYRNGQLADTIEYFGWSGKNSKAPWGISLSTESSDYAGEFLDWGTNTITGSAPNTWRTLSNDEWLYICQGRKNADQLLGLGKISSIFGLIILPDDWVAPEGITFTPNDNNPNANVYSLQQWTAMEEAGAIFIPPTGYFNHDIDNMRYVGTYGYARNNTLTANGLQIYTLFKPSEIQYSRSAQGNNGNLYYAFPQRLVHDTIVPMPEPEYVDLGLSVKWATFNVGATSPEDYGDYFAWGETEPKETYSWATYKWGTSSNLTKYNTTDGKTILDLDDDAAYVNWGGYWRMPSKEEVDELTQQCNWIWTTHNNINGYKVTGPNGNSIFLPAAGYKGAGPTYTAGEDGLYWTSTLEKGHYSYLIVLHDDAPPTEASTKGTRCFGFTIRPVYDEVPDPCLVVKVNDTLSINLMCVEGGTFMMGSDAPDAQADEQPVHEVTLSDYYIGQTEVTQHLWKAVMGSDNNPSAVKGNNLPVTNITWDEAQQFVERLSELTGMRFRLPTEAEWEYAARGGQYSKGYTYAGSNDIDQVGWYNGNSSNKTHAVGQKQPNELGIYDMTGNVWEYCSDWHMPYAAQAQTNPTGAATGDKHVLRGGCYHYDSKNCTSTNRHSYYTPDKGGASTGLRIVLEP